MLRYFLQSGKAKGFEVCFLIRQGPGIRECDFFLRAVLGVCAMVVQLCPRELNMYFGKSSTVNTLSPEPLQPKSFSQLETPNLGSQSVGTHRSGLWMPANCLSACLMPPTGMVGHASDLPAQKGPEP